MKENSFQVLNFGIPGYNTEQEVDFYIDQGHLYKPDVLIIFFYKNDVADIKKIQSTMDNLIKSKKYQYLLQYLEFKTIYKLLREESLLEYNEKYSLPENNMGLVVTSLNKLNYFINSSIPIILVGFYDTPTEHVKQLEMICEEYKWYFLNLNSLIQDYSEDSIYIGPDMDPVDTHPSIIGHQLIAQTLFESLEINGLV